MPNPGRPEEYLNMAQQAEQAADEAQTRIAKNYWRAIADEYRAIAAERLKRMQHDSPETLS
jgi:hypothetical protein